MRSEEEIRDELERWEEKRPRSARDDLEAHCRALEWVLEERESP